MDSSRNIPRMAVPRKMRSICSSTGLWWCTPDDVGRLIGDVIVDHSAYLGRGKSNGCERTGNAVADMRQFNQTSRLFDGTADVVQPDASSGGWRLLRDVAKAPLFYPEVGTEVKVSFHNGISGEGLYRNLCDHLFAIHKETENLHYQNCLRQTCSSSQPFDCLLVCK